MVVKPFENEYDKQIYDCIKEDTYYDDLCEGEKAILYDLIHQIQNTIRFDWSTTDMSNLIRKCYLSYQNNKSKVTIQVVANCINDCFPDKKAMVVGSAYESKILVIEDK